MMPAWDRSHGDLKYAFAERGPVDMLFAFKRRKNGVEREVLAQRMHIRPVVVQGHASADWGWPCASMPNQS